ncbi:MAG: hypothetical protein ACJ78Q_06510, partial [Chloroflexia bacterium]
MTRLLIASGGLLLLICASALLAGRPSEERVWAAQTAQAQPTHQRDPDLKPGFPVGGDGVGRAGIGGPRNNVLVGDVDGKPGLEIVLPPYAWHADGSRVAGWPLTNVATGGAQALGRLSPASKGLDVVSTSPIV